MFNSDKRVYICEVLSVHTQIHYLCLFRRNPNDNNFIIETYVEYENQGYNVSEQNFQFFEKSNL